MPGPRKPLETPRVPLTPKLNPRWEHSTRRGGLADTREGLLGRGVLGGGREEEEEALGSGDASCAAEAMRTRTGTAGRRAQGGADSGWRGLKRGVQDEGDAGARAGGPGCKAL